MSQAFYQFDQILFQILLNYGQLKFKSKEMLYQKLIWIKIKINLSPLVHKYSYLPSLQIAKEKKQNNGEMKRRHPLAPI